MVLVEGRDPHQAVDAVLDGEIEPFIEGWLRWRLDGGVSALSTEGELDAQRANLTVD